MDLGNIYMLSGMQANLPFDIVTTSWIGKWKDKVSISITWKSFKLHFLNAESYLLVKLWTAPIIKYCGGVLF